MVLLLTVNMCLLELVLFYVLHVLEREAVCLLGLSGLRVLVGGVGVVVIKRCRKSPTVTF